MMKKSSVSRTQRFTHFQILCYLDIDGEPMEFEWNIFQDSPHRNSATKSKSSCRKCAKSQNNLHDGSSSCRCSTTSHGDLKTLKISMRKYFHQENGHSSWIRKEVVFYTRIQTTTRMGHSCRTDDDKILVKGDTQFSVPRNHCPKERSEAKVVENYQYTSTLMREQMKLFFAQLYLSINSVLTEQSHICVNNTNLAM